MSFLSKPSGPPRLILADAGNVRVVYETGHRAKTVAKWLSLEAEAVDALIHRSHVFHRLERGECSWEHYLSFVETTVCARVKDPGLWDRERFAEIWVEALTQPIMPVIEILEALAKHVPVVSASNVDACSYRVYDRLPRARAMLAVHSDSHVIGRRKGDPDYFETLLRYVNGTLGTDVIPGQCVFIDDRPEYVAAAISAGVRTCWLADRTPGDIKILRDHLVERGGVPEAWLP